MSVNLQEQLVIDESPHKCMYVYKNSLSLIRVHTNVCTFTRTACH